MFQADDILYLIKEFFARVLDFTNKVSIMIISGGNSLLFKLRDTCIIFIYGNYYP
jgi:hypothetical protein